MYKKQREITEKALFDYYMISSCKENEIHSPFPYYMERKIYRQMTAYADILNRLVMRIVDSVISEPNEYREMMGDFCFKEEILRLKCPVLPFFWVRYDAFIREKGGIFFSEFNYDKPCAQREILISDDFEPQNNPNSHFRQTFIENFHSLCRPLLKSKKKIGIAFLVSPEHDEEMHLVYLFMELLHSDSYEFMMVSPDNLCMVNDTLCAFDRTVDLLVRLFPTEQLDSIADFERILQLHAEGKIAIVNDPRAIIGQSKALFAYLWKLVKENSASLSGEEREVIIKSIPYTCLFAGFDLNELKEQKDGYVVKAAFGRYSEQVYIGAEYSREEWLEIIDQVAQSAALHIVQEYCPIKREKVLRYWEGRYIYDDAYGNYGIYLSNNSVCGSCIRWSDNSLSDDDTVWISPIGLNNRFLSFINMVDEKSYREVWRTINDEAAFQHGFSGGYTGDCQSFSLNALLLDKPLYEEIKTAAVRISRIIDKTIEYVQQNGAYLYDVLGIPQGLQSIVSQKICGYHNFIGRFDFVLDSVGNLKLLEFNSETPAGMIESIVLNDAILKESKRGLTNPNAGLKSRIFRRFSEIIKSYEAVKPIKTIAFVSLSYPEDYYNTRFLFDALKDLPYHFVFGEVSGLSAKDDQLTLYNEPVDAVYRYYPLDWFDSDPYFEGVIPSLEKSAFSINPPSSFIAQSKAFFALIWELTKSPFYDESEKSCIEKYIPFTSLGEDDFPDGDYCYKPCYSREGDGVGLSILESGQPDSSPDLVYQQRVDIRPVKMDLYTNRNKFSEIVYPVIGAYVLGEDFGGIYTRAGNVITDKNAVYIPTYIKD